MASRILVSRKGMTNCPSCAAHIKVAAELQETACPFCGEALAVSVRSSGSIGQSAMQRVAQAGRSGLLAASLLGMAATGPLACSEEEPEPTGDMSMDMASDSAVSALYGGVPDASETATAMDATAVTDIPSTAAYGSPAVDANTGPDQSEPDATAAPAYGIPADAVD